MMSDELYVSGKVLSLQQGSYRCTVDDSKIRRLQKGEVPTQQLSRNQAKKSWNPKKTDPVLFLTDGLAGQPLWFVHGERTWYGCL